MRFRATEVSRATAGSPTWATPVLEEGTMSLDILGVDDQINTGQHPDVWDTCHRLADVPGDEDVSQLRRKHVNVRRPER